MNKVIIYCAVSLCAVFCLSFIWAVSSSRIHDFKDKCLMCHKPEGNGLASSSQSHKPEGNGLLSYRQSHMDIPDKASPEENLSFADEIDKLCGKCHTIDKEKSHPVAVRPGKALALSWRLDKNGLMTCTTCHDVHKEDKTSNRSELSGLLWGHTKGRAFCGLCHNQNASPASWRHETAIPYAHPSGKLTQSSGGSLLDKFSTECLSCHDDILSKSAQVEVKQGLWRHSLGLSHPVGIDYPRSQDFALPEALPKEIRLFAEKVGCLSCHEVYGRKKDMLVIDNQKSRLCLACHKK